jgi:ribosomal protein L22
MEARAISRYNRQSPRKMRLVIDLIRGKNVGEAYAILQFSKKKAGPRRPRRGIGGGGSLGCCR